MSWWYPKEKKLNKRDAEAYAHACYDILNGVTGESGSKMYDPLTIIGQVAHSYVFNLKDGGRHHSFESIESLIGLMRDETIENINNFIEDNEPSNDRLSD